MLDELAELIDSDIYKEISSRALYEAAQSTTSDPGARALLKELAEQEARHSELLKNFKEKGLAVKRWHPEKMADLKMSEYLTGSDSLEGAAIQDVLIFAIKREQQSLDFYSRMTEVLRDRPAKELGLRLVQEELKHKIRLELLYDEMFYREN